METNVYGNTNFGGPNLVRCLVYLHHILLNACLITSRTPIIFYGVVYMKIKVSVKLIYLLTANGLSPGGSSTVQYTFTHKQYTERYKTNNTQNNSVRTVPRLGKFYPGICLATDEKARKNLSHGSRTIRIHRPNNKNT